LHWEKPATCNATEFPGLLDALSAADSLFGILERELQVELGYADEELLPLRRSEEFAETLSIPAAIPSRIRQVIYSSKGWPIM